VKAADVTVVVLVRNGRWVAGNEGGDHGNRRRFRDQQGRPGWRFCGPSESLKVALLSRSGRDGGRRHNKDSSNRK